MDHTPTIRRLYDLINSGDIDGFGRQLAEDFAEREDLLGFTPNKARSGRGSACPDFLRSPSAPRNIFAINCRGI